MNAIPYSCQSISREDIEAVCAVLGGEFITQGPAIVAFENAFRVRHCVSNAIAVSNATAGLHIACLALGVGAGSRVWTTPNSFVASANCALYCGASVDFVDIDPSTRNMSVQALREKLHHARLAGVLPHVVVPVHFSGLPADLCEMRELADSYNFKILEDASHATGATYRGSPVGSAYAHASVFSFHAVKIITTAEGGMVTTQDDELARKLRLLRSHGITRDPLELKCQSEGGWYYEQQILGFNCRMTDLQAALGASQLKRLDDMRSRREELAGQYDERLAELPLVLPARIVDRQSSWHLYVVEIDGARTSRTRTEVYQAMRAGGIGVNVHYIPIHTQPYYLQRGFNVGDFPVSEYYYSRALSLPLYPEMSNLQQEIVVAALSEALR